MTKQKELISLETVLTKKPTKENYAKFTQLLAEGIQSLYTDLDFLKQVPAEYDKESGTLLLFTIHSKIHTELFDKLFKYAMEHNLDEYEASDYFVESFAKGDILPLGAVTIDKENTAVSSATDSEDIRIMISCLTPERVEQAKKAKKEKEVQEKSKQELDKKQNEEVEKLTNIRVSTMKTLGLASETLLELTKKQVEAHELTELKDKVSEVERLVY